MILLPCPVRPDLDCIAGSLAYAEYLRAQGKAAKAWLCGTPDGEAQFYLQRFPDFEFASAGDIAAMRHMVLVDFSDVRYIPQGTNPEDVIEVIDHRFFNNAEKHFFNARIQLDAVGAAATQITEHFMQSNLTPSEASACLLYGAIYSNTLCLKGALCTDRDRAAAEWLKARYPDADRYIDL